MLIIMLFKYLSQIRQFAFTIHFPEQLIQTNLYKAALEYLNQTNNRKIKEGITWGYALCELPRDLLNKHGFIEVPFDSFYVPGVGAMLDYTALDDAIIDVRPECFLIPPKEVRLMQISSNMSAYLMRDLDLEILLQNPAGLRKRIAEFAVIWAPRFVDLNLFDLEEFIIDALNQTPRDFWEVPREDEDVAPEEFNSWTTTSLF